MLCVSTNVRGLLGGCGDRLYLNSIPGHHEVYSNIIRGRYWDVF